MELTDNDESVRDLKKALLKAAEPRAGPRAESWAPTRGRDDVLHPEIGRLRDLAEPGGFRRAHLKTKGSQIKVFYDGARVQSLMQLMLNPKYNLGLLDVTRDREEDEEDEEIRAGASDTATVLIILKSMIGGTLLIIPGGFRSAGILPATTLLLGMGTTEIFCMVELIACSKSMGGGSFSDVASAAFGQIAGLVVDASLLLSQLGFVCAELLYVAKNGSAAFETLGWAQISITEILLYQLVFLIPMSWVRRLEYFTVTNLMATVVILTSVVSLAAVALARLSTDGAQEIELWTPQWSLFAGTAVFCFEIINFVIPMYEAHNNKDNFLKILVSTLMFLMTCFVCWGWLNYMAYGEATADVLTLNLDKNSAVGKGVPLAFAFASFCTAPLLLFPAAVVVESYCVGSSESDFRRKWKKNSLRIFLSLLCTFVAIVGADQIEVFISVLGALTCVPLAFIYPALFHLKLCADTPMRKCTDVLIMSAGFVVFLVTGKEAIETFIKNIH